jgi:hypothetical protein
VSAALGAARRTATIPKSYAHRPDSILQFRPEYAADEPRGASEPRMQKTVPADCVPVIRVVRRGQPRVRTLLSPEKRSIFEP